MVGKKAEGLTTKRVLGWSGAIVLAIGIIIGVIVGVVQLINYFGPAIWGFVKNQWSGMIVGAVFMFILLVTVMVALELYGRLSTKRSEIDNNKSRRLPNSRYFRSDELPENKAVGQ